MTFGIILRGINNAYFKDNLGFVFEFLPQLVFMVFIFGYMDFMIIYKWLIDYSGMEWKAPNITSTLLDMFLKVGGVSEFTSKLGDKELKYKRVLYGPNDGSLQETVQLVLLIVGVLMIPIVLIPKPIILNSRNTKKENVSYYKILFIFSI